MSCGRACVSCWRRTPLRRARLVSPKPRPSSSALVISLVRRALVTARSFLARRGHTAGLAMQQVFGIVDTLRKPLLLHAFGLNATLFPRRYLLVVQLRAAQSSAACLPELAVPASWFVIATNRHDHELHQRCAEAHPLRPRVRPEDLAASLVAGGRHSEARQEIIGRLDTQDITEYPAIPSPALVYRACFAKRPQPGRALPATARALPCRKNRRPRGRVSQF